MAEEQNKYFYRFRKLKHIFEYKELENLEIYFASNEELNDPMEAYKTVIFQGDSIMWHNLFKNYILCLSRFIFINILKGDNDKLIQLDASNILTSFDNKTYTTVYYDLFMDIYSKFREHFTKEINHIFCKNNIITEEMLKVYLYILNNIIINIISMYYYKKSTKEINQYIINSKQDIFNILNSYKISFDKNKKSRNIIAKQYYEDLLIPPLTDRDKFPFNNELSHYIFGGRFTDEYVNYLTSFVRFKVYTSSFNADYTNPVMWSHYTENHNGICLIYNNINNKMKFFKDETYTKEIPPKNVTLEFIKMQYRFKDYPINFFYAFLSSNKEILDNWTKDILTNKKSKIYDKFKYNKKYQQNILNLIANPLNKSRHWSYEKEYRLILNNKSILEKEDRKYRYDFKYLNGIIFGIKTPLSKKLKIIEIIKELCKKHNRNIDTFNFYQAYLKIPKNNISYYSIYIKAYPTEHDNE